MHSLSRPLLSLLASSLLGAAFVLPSAAQPSAPETPGTATFSPDPAQTAISPLLLGTQFNYFSPPMVSHLKNRDLLHTWEELPVKLLRYPGGTWADHYLWDNPPGSYFVSGNASTIVTPAQFIEACRTIGAEPIFQVNTGSKGGSNNNRINPTKIEDIRAGALNAANWVRNANIVNHWGVKYWEIGNEVWIWLHPEEYAQYVVEYSKAMKAADPTIKIIACGLSGKVGPFGAPWLKFPKDPEWQPRLEVVNEADAWNEALFTIAKDSFDYVAPHPYVQPKAPEKVPSKEYALEIAKNPVDHYLKTTAVVWDREALKKQQELFKKYNSTARLAVTEWATNYSYSVPGSNSWDPRLYFYTLGNGLNTALYFGRIAEGAGVTDIAVLHCIEDIQTIWYWPKKEAAAGEPLPHPTYLAMKIWGHHLGNRMLSVKTSGIAPLAIDGKSYPSLYLYGSEDDRYLYLVAINLDPAAAHEVALRAQDLPKTQGKAVCTWMTGPAIDSTNFEAWGNPSAQPIKLSEDSLDRKDDTWMLRLPAHSMVGVKIEKTP